MKGNGSFGVYDLRCGRDGVQRKPWWRRGGAVSRCTFNVHELFSECKQKRDDCFVSFESDLMAHGTDEYVMTYSSLSGRVL